MSLFARLNLHAVFLLHPKKGFNCICLFKTNKKKSCSLNSILELLEVINEKSETVTLPLLALV